MARKRKPTADEVYDRRFRNDPGPESRDLTNDEVELFQAARQSIDVIKKQFEHWTIIGKAVAAARARADRVGGGKTFRRILEQQGLARVVPPATATRLLAIIDNLPAVTAWHATLTEHQQIAWASPSAVFKHCPVFAKAKGGARPTRTLPRIGLEIAIDAVLDHLHAADADNRLAVIERILGPFDLAAMPKAVAGDLKAAFAAQATLRPKRKAKPAKAKGEAQPAPDASGLIWKEGKPLSDLPPDHKANVGRGYIHINPEMDLMSMRFIDYAVSYSVARERRGDGRVAIRLGEARTVVQAKRIAETAARDLPALEARLDQRAQEEIAEREQRRRR